MSSNLRLSVKMPETRSSVMATSAEVTRSERGGGGVGETLSFLSLDVGVLRTLAGEAPVEKSDK